MVYTICYKLKCSNCILLEWGLRIPDLYILVPTFKMKHIALVLRCCHLRSLWNVWMYPFQFTVLQPVLFCGWRWPIASRISYSENDGCLQMPLANTFSSSSHVLICVMLTDAVSATDLFSKLSFFKLSSFGKYMPMSPSYFPFLANLYPHDLPYSYDKWWTPRGYYIWHEYSISASKY